MFLKFSMNQTKNFNLISAQQDIQILFQVCSCIGLPQKTISFSWYLYFAIKEDNFFLEPDDMTLFSAIIIFACKACETQRSPDKIIELTAQAFSIELDPEIFEMYKAAINKTQVDLCEAIDYRFEIIEIYNKLQTFCLNFKIDAAFSKRSWILLNDMMSTPVCIYFTCDEIIASIIFINFVATESINSSESLSNKELYEKFLEMYSLQSISLECIEFIYNYILNFYQISKSS